jgi:hypothetical protein
MLPLPIQMVSFWERYVFLQLSWIGLFVTKWAFLHQENSDLQEIFLSQKMSILTGIQCTKWSCFSHTRFSMERYMFFFNLAEYTYLEQNEAFFTLKILICRKYSFQKPTQFLHGITVLHAPALTQIVLFKWYICSST